MMVEKKRSRSPEELIGRDYGWIAAQLVLMGVGFLASPLEWLRFGRAYVPGHRIIAIGAGLGLLLGALAVAGKAFRDLGSSTSMSPTPLADAEMVEHGIYGAIRHPMYLAVMLALAGWAVIWGTISGLVLTGAGMIFFTLKSRHEERLCIDRYPQYEEYRQRVTAKFVPNLW